MQLIILGCSLFALVLADINLDLQIFKGEEVKDGDIPYQVQIHTDIPEGIYLCGGCLISQTWIISAAHCIDTYPIENTTTFLGSVRFGEGTKRQALKKIVHPEWDGDLKAGNDIGLLEIESISYSDTIKSISLAPLSDMSENYEYHIAAISGWGYVNSTSISKILKRTYLIVVTEEDCHAFYPEDEFKDIICAVDVAGSTVCPGDSGGPLVDIDSKHLIGITSFAPALPCGTTPYGTGYTRVNSWRKWINDNTGI